MTRRWLFVLPLVALALVVANLGLRTGLQQATLTETEVINRYAARYLDEGAAGASLRDCLAVPSDADALWLVVRCGPDPDGVTYSYHVDSFGSLNHRRPPYSGADQPAPGNST